MNIVEIGTVEIYTKNFFGNPLNVREEPLKGRGWYSYCPGNKEPDPEHTDDHVLLHFVFGDEHIGQKIEICKK